VTEEWEMARGGEEKGKGGGLDVSIVGKDESKAGLRLLRTSLDRILARSRRLGFSFSDSGNLDVAM
jgi:hypothetical protein